MEIKNNTSQPLEIQTSSLSCFCKIKDYCRKKISIIAFSSSALIIGSAFVFATVGTAALITTITLIAFICFKNRNKIAKKICITTPKPTNPTKNNDCSWFRSQDINPYLNHLNQSHPNVFFLMRGQEIEPFKQTVLDIAQKRQGSTEYCALEGCDCFNSPCLNCLEDKYGTKNIEKYHTVAFPMNIKNSHWVLTFVDFEKKTIEYYDSLLNYGPHTQIVEEFTELAKRIGFNFVCKITQKIQHDGYQCGPWTCYFLEERLKNPEVDFNKLNIKESQLMIADYRKHILETNSSQI